MSHSYESTAHDPTRPDTRPKTRTLPPLYEGLGPGKLGGARGSRGKPGEARGVRDFKNPTSLLACLAAAGQGPPAAQPPSPAEPALTRTRGSAGIAHTLTHPLKNPHK